MSRVASGGRSVRVIEGERDGLGGVDEDAGFEEALAESLTRDPLGGAAGADHQENGDEAANEG